MQCGKTALYLVPQVFGWAAYVSIEVRHVDKLCDAGRSGCLGNLLRDGHEDIFIAIVAVNKKRRNTCMSMLAYNLHAYSAKSPIPHLQASFKFYSMRTIS